MRRDKERAKLLAKIARAAPKLGERRVALAFELASNDDLKRFIATNQAVIDALADSEPDQAFPYGLSPRYSEGERELFRRILCTSWNPSGEYTFARDECGDWYTGPDWVPFNLYSTSSYPGPQRDLAKVLIEAPGARKLWSDIGARYGRDPCDGSGLDARRNNHVDSIAASLPAVCADAQANWAAIPRLTPSKFKEQREELARRAEQLAQELERFYLPRDPDEYEFPGLLDFTDLMSQEERDRLDQAIRVTTARIANRARVQAGVRAMDWDEYNDIGDDARALGYRDGDVPVPAREDAAGVYALLLLDHTNYNNTDWYGGVPTLPNMLRRIAKKFEEDGNDPPIKNPNLANAERNFFARALCKYFWTSFGDVSPAIVRDIVTMFYPQSITENDVSQMVSKIKAAHPLPES